MKSKRALAMVVLLCILSILAPRARAVTGQLLAGAAKVSLTPVTDAVPGGPSSRFPKTWNTAIHPVEGN
jgi:hypothetical protein